MRVDADILLSSNDPASVLSEHGYVYIDRLRTVDRLARLGRMLGVIVPAGVGMAPDAFANDAYEVRVRDGGAGALDEFGNTIISTTAQAFAFHTDGYNRDPPPRYVLLLRTDGSDELPESFFADTRVILQNPSHESLVERLCQPCYPSATGGQSIVFNRTAGFVRFNPLEIDRWAVDTCGDSSWQEPVQSFGALLGETRVVDYLRPGDAVLLDNWRACHGRSELRAASERTVLRMWVQ